MLYISFSLARRGGYKIKPSQELLALGTYAHLQLVGEKSDIKNV